jgi:dipeptidyl aminopeptidase/acylaminoacyl peptidase
MNIQNFLKLFFLSFILTACQSKDKLEITRAEYIPREVLFGNPKMTSAKLSPDGQMLAYLADHKGVLNIWVQKWGEPQTARPVTQDQTRGIFNFNWTYKLDTLIYSQDRLGDENFGIYTLNAKSGKVTEITKPGRFTSGVVEVSHLRPNEVVIRTNDKDPRFFNYKILNLNTKAQTLLYSNDKEFSQLYFDKSYRPVIATKTNSDASSDLYLWDVQQKQFVKKSTVAFEDNLSTYVLNVSFDGKKVFLSDSTGTNTSALIEWDLTTDKKTKLAQHPKSDLVTAFFHPTTEKVLSASFNFQKVEHVFFDEEIKNHFANIEKSLNQNFGLASVSHDANKWVIVTNEPNQPSAYYFFDATKGTISSPFYVRPDLVEFQDQLHPMEAVEIQSRDGFPLVSYLTRSKYPAGQSLVLLVHGGPWSRDQYGYNSYHQWLADRGYHVLSVNFRGSTGFGKKFLNAGDLEWGKKMHDDLLDAVIWAVENKIADPNQIVIMGGSYGGYAALAGLTFSPKTFAAAIDIVGPSNLETLLTSIPSYWESFKTTLYKRVGDPTTESGRKILKERSPLNHVDKIERPLLILQGANDPRVKKAESDQIYNAMVKKQIPVEYVLFPDEGHGFYKSQNNRAANAIIENFLQKILKGRLEPIEEDVKNSSAKMINAIQ